MTMADLGKQFARPLSWGEKRIYRAGQEAMREEAAQFVYSYFYGTDAALLLTRRIRGLPIGLEGTR